MGQCMREEVGTVEEPAGQFTLEQHNRHEQIAQIAPRKYASKLTQIA